MATTLIIRDVPDDVYETLVSRARSAGLSLNEYLVQQLCLLVPDPASSEAVDRARALACTLPPARVGALLDDLRAERR